MASTQKRPVAVVDEDGTGYQIETPGSSPQGPYAYTALPSRGEHFRLMKLAPGSTKRLCCDINIYSIEGSERPSFKALSYSWQNPKFDDLTIAGRSIPADDKFRSEYTVCHALWCGGKRILISTSLRDALRALRHETHPVWLWIDALCINQEDTDERSSQVLRMQRIYHIASQVCMWLGTKCSFTDPAFQLSRQLQNVAPRRASLRPADLYSPHTLQSFGLPSFPGEKWESLIRLLERPYFRRIWIVQEMMAAGLTARIYCGDSDIPFMTILEALLFLNEIKWITPIDGYYGGNNSASYLLVVHGIRLAWMQGATSDQERFQLRRLAEATRSFGATDPRDKVFALICIVNDFGHRDLSEIDDSNKRETSQATVKAGTVHLNFTLDERGKSGEDIAIGILYKSPNEEIRLLRQSLLDMLRGAVCTADVILLFTPSRSMSEWYDDYDLVVNRATIGVQYICQFKKEYKSTSLHHQRVGDFGMKTMTMFGEEFIQMVELIAETVSSGKFSDICNHPVVRERVARLKNGTSWLVESLEKDASYFKSKDGDRTPILLGDREILDTMEFSVKINRKYPEWAWSAAGWTLPRYDRPVDEIFTEYAVKCILDDDNLDVLSLVEDSSERKISELPSWAPDCSTELRRHPLIRTSRDGGHIYSAAGFLKPRVRWNVLERSILYLEGCKIDEIVSIASESSARSVITDQYETWNELVAELPESYSGGGTKREALWRTLVGDCIAGQSGFESPAPSKYEGFYHSFFKLVRFNKELEQEGSRDNIPRLFIKHGLKASDLPRLIANKDEFVREMSEVMLHRRLFLTKGGLIGAGPISARVGDPVYIFARGAVPYILRKQGEPAFRLVGDCYVHGLMKGEALKRDGFGWAEVRLQ